MLDEWQEQYPHNSLSKGTAHFKIQKKVTTKPWFTGMIMNGTGIQDLIETQDTPRTLWFKETHVWTRIFLYICNDCNLPNDLEHIVMKWRQISND